MTKRYSAKGFEVGVTEVGPYINGPTVPWLRFRFFQMDHGKQKQSFQIYEPKAFSRAILQIAQTQSSGTTTVEFTDQRIDLSFTREGGEIKLTIQPENKTFGPWGTTILEEIVFAMRFINHPGNSARVYFPESDIDELCKTLGGEFERPLESMQKYKRLNYQFDLLRMYCRERNPEVLWANSYGWGWEHCSNKEPLQKPLFVVLRYHPSSGIISVEERHGVRWKRPFALYNSDEESEAIAHVRSLV